jgi:hypothetical protein
MVMVSEPARRNSGLCRATPPSSKYKQRAVKSWSTRFSMKVCGFSLNLGGFNPFNCCSFAVDPPSSKPATRVQQLTEFQAANNACAPSKVPEALIDGASFHESQITWNSRKHRKDLDAIIEKMAAVK